MERLFFHVAVFRTRKRAIVTVLLFVAGILAAAPVLPKVADWFRTHGLLHAALFAAFLVPLGYIFAYLIHQVRVAHGRAYFILLLILVTAVALTLPGRDTPEHFHVLVYALLALFIYKLTSFGLKGVAGYAVPLMATFAVGFLDEVVQDMTPGRFFSLRDVSDNAVGAFVAIAFIYIRRHYGRALHVPEP